MKEKDIILEIPYGTRDFLPGEAARKREIETRISSIFTLFGYDEVVTPTIEYLSTLTTEGEAIEPHLFKFFDKQNRTLALRHEMTTPIARVVASRMRGEPLPIRLSYVSNVCRYEEAQAGRQCEFYQAGVELMGSSSPAADAEVIALAATCIKDAGLKDFQICLGNVKFINGLMKDFGLDASEQDEIRRMMEKHDLVGLRGTLGGTSLDDGQREVLASLPLLHGGDEVIERARGIAANDESREALGNLMEIYRLLKSYGVDEFVYFDLGVIRDFSYYTGMVFEAYTPGLGFPLAGGGRYDRLLSDFGSPCPATGFALGIERLMLALEREGRYAERHAGGVFIAYAEGKRDEAIREATRYRSEGIAASLATSPMSEAEANDCPLRRRYESLAYIK